MEDANVVQAGEVLEDKVQVGNKVIIIGGESVGCETAEFLADKGKSVIVMRRGSQMALSAGYSLRAALIDRLLKKNVTLLTDITYNEVTPNGLVVTNKKGERKAIKVDTIVLAAGSVPDKELCRAIETMVPEVYIIGDCIQPRTIRDAIADGYSVGLRM